MIPSVFVLLIQKLDLVCAGFTRVPVVVLAAIEHD
jgi:hypothetical protein